MTVADVMPYVLLVGVLVNVLAVITFVWKGLAGIWHAVNVLIEVRDDFRAMAGKIGQKYPPDGLLGDVEAIKNKQDEDHEKIVVIEAGIAQRRESDKK